jgi:hypothetical protein
LGRFFASTLLLIRMRQPSPAHAAALMPEVFPIVNTGNFLRLLLRALLK